MKREALLVSVVAGSVAAAPPPETPTGSNVPGGRTSSPVHQVGNVPPDWNDTDIVPVKETRRMVRRFAQCVVKKHPNSAALVVSSDVSNEQIVREYAMLNDEDCAFQADRTDSGFKLTLRGNGFRYALAEALVNAQFPEPWAAISTAPPMQHRVHDPARFTPKPGEKYAPDDLKRSEQARSLDEGLVFAEQFGECVVRADPVNARRLLSTQPVSTEEDAAVTALYPRLPGCVPAGRKVTINVDVVRGAVALSYYRLARSLQGASMQVAHR